MADTANTKITVTCRTDKDRLVKNDIWLGRKCYRVDNYFDITLGILCHLCCYWRNSSLNCFYAD